MVDRMVAAVELDKEAMVDGAAIPRVVDGRLKVPMPSCGLCSISSSYVTGVALPVDGGLAAGL